MLVPHVILGLRFRIVINKTEEQATRLHENRRVSRRLLRNCRRLLEIQVQELNGSVGLTSESGPHHGGG